MSNRKPKIEYYWTEAATNRWPVVNWRLVGSNGGILCQSTQGHRDKTDAQRSVLAVLRAFSVIAEPDAIGVREVGPGRKPS